MFYTATVFAIASATALIVSWFVPLQWDFASGRQRHWVICVQRGGLCIANVLYTGDERYRKMLIASTVYSNSATWLPRISTDASSMLIVANPDPRLNDPGGLFSYYYSVNILTVPLYLMTLLLAAFPTWEIVRSLQRRCRNQAGCCINCGYNLKGNTSGICPECGAPVVPEAPQG